MGDGLKELMFYTENPDDVKKSLDKISKDIKGYDIEMSVEKDKDWEFFKSHCPQNKN